MGSMNKQEKKKLQEMQARINSDAAQLLKKLLNKAIDDITAEPKRDTLEFKEIIALVTGIKTGAKMYSEGMAILLKHMNLSEDYTAFAYDLKKQNDQGIFALISSLTPPPPKTNKGETNND